MKKLGVWLVLVLGLNSAYAQKYITAAGVRISKQQVGLTLQQRFLPKTTLEIIGAVGMREYSGSALIEQHFPIITKGLNYYMGAGAHLGELKDRGTFYGGDVILGAEMKIPFLPITLSADLKPAFHTNHDDWFSFGGGISVRTILIKEKKKKFKLFGSDSNDKDDNGWFGKKKEKLKDDNGWFSKQKEKLKSWWVGDEDEKEEVKEEEGKPKFRLFRRKEEPKQEEEKKFNLFGF